MNRKKRTLLTAALLIVPLVVAYVGLAGLAAFPLSMGYALSNELQPEPAAPAEPAPPSSVSEPMPAPEPAPPSARFPGDGFELRVYQDAEQAIPPSIFSIPGDGRHPDPPPGGSFRASCNVFLVIEGDRRILVDAGNGAPRGALLAKLRADGVDPATITDVLLTHEHRDHVGGLVGPDGAAAFPNATLHALVPPGVDLAPFRPDLYELRAFADPAAATNLPAGFVAEPGPGHTPCHVFYRKGTLLFVGDAFHAIDLQYRDPWYCAKWDQDPVTAFRTREALIERVWTNLPKHRETVFPLSSPPVDHPPLFLCGAHIPFPGIVSKVRQPMGSAREAPSFDMPEPGTPIPDEPHPLESSPPEPLVKIHRRAEAVPATNEIAAGPAANETAADPATNELPAR